MQSWEVLRDAAERIGVKALAAKLKLSTALVYKWCQEAPSEAEPTCSGARNPLDRLKMIVTATGDPGIINWLCQAADGFYVANPAVNPNQQEEQILTSTQHVVQDFGDLLANISHGIEDDGQISPEEAEQIRQSWERLKTQAECFVVACERGLYRQPGDDVAV